MVEFWDAGMNVGKEAPPNDCLTAMDSQSKMTKQQSIQSARQTTMFRPILADMRRRAKLKMKQGEVEGTLTFEVDKSKVLRLTPSDGTAGVRMTLYRRIEGLAEIRKDDDSSYYTAVGNGFKVTVILPLPESYETGGWRCHASHDEGECLQSNKPDDEKCISCKSPKPELKSQFEYLRLLSSSIRDESREYLRIIRDCDTDLSKCEATEEDAKERISIATEKHANEQSHVSSSDDESEDDPLMMNVELVQSGVWQRVHADTVLSLLARRKQKGWERLNSARAELSIMIQSAYDLAAPHAQKVVRGFLLRASLERIRREVCMLAEFSAAVEIQRVIRSALATREVRRLRTSKCNLVAIKIQCLLRRRISYLERMRRWSLHCENLRKNAAINIQSLYRSHRCKLKAKQMTEDNLRQLEEKEKARLVNLENEKATIIQSHFRRCISVAKCANRRIEMSLHERLLMYIERFTFDGDFFSFVKSLNDDYIRYEKSIMNTIEREEKMAKTFVEKVLKTRDLDHSVAWQNYLALKRQAVASDQTAGTNNQQHSAMWSERAAIMEELNQGVLGKPKLKDGRAWERTKNFSVTTKLYGSNRRGAVPCSARSSSRLKIKTKSLRHTKVDVSGSLSNKNNVESRAVDVPTPTDVPQADESITSDSQDLDVHHQQQVGRLAKMHQMTERLRGQYIRFDIPNGLDDTTARFINAVALRYNFACPEETSSLHGSFNLSSFDKERQREALAYADSLIQRLHGKGLVFIRQLLPLDHMINVLSNMKVSDEFLFLASSLLAVLHKVTGGNYLSRRYLMAECKDFLATQKYFKSTSVRLQRSEFGEITSRLGEFGAGGCDEFDDGDIPGGLWATRKTEEGLTDSENISGSQHSLPLKTEYDRRRVTGRSKSWAVAYTRKVLHQNVSKHPAYRNYALLTGDDVNP